LRHSGSYGALHETHREVDEQQNTPAATPEREAHRPNYEALRETQHEVDERQEGIRLTQRSWTHYGGMVPQQHSAIKWHNQNIEIKMAQNQNSGPERAEEGAQPNQENDLELQEARAAVEEARRREAAERARQQERGRDGPER
jgi:hypothetical protein